MLVDENDGRCAGEPAGVAQRRDPARGTPPRGPKRFRGADPGVFTLVCRAKVGIAGRFAQQAAAADAQADAEADGRLPARPVDAVRGRWGQHGRRVVLRGQQPAAEPAAKGSPLQVSQNRPTAECGPCTRAGPACRLMPCRGAAVDTHSATGTLYIKICTEPACAI